ncbi:hypothetical protein ABFX02_10G092100 [Erythranthe guttata]
MEGSPPVYQIPSSTAVRFTKYLWRGFLIANFGLAAYMFALPSKKERQKDQSEVPPEAAHVPPAEAAPVPASEAVPVPASEAAPVLAAPVPAEAAPILAAEAAPIHASEAAPVHASEAAPIHASEAAPIPAAETAPILIREETVYFPPIPKPVIVRQHMPEEQQREIFKWILEERRKVKPLNQEEMKRIDEDKAILEQFIRSDSVPTI